MSVLAQDQSAALAGVPRRRAPVGRWALNGAAGVSLGFILLPLVLVTWLAFFRQEIPSFPPEGYSLQWFGAVLNNKSFVSGFILSSQVGIAATLIGVVLALPASLAIARRRFYGRGIVNALMLMPLIVPGVVLGTSIYVFQIETEVATGLPLLGSTWGLIAAHALIVIPWAARLVSASLESFDPAIEEAAKNLGAGPWTTFYRVTLPSIRPGIVAGALFGFVTSFGNLEMSLFLVGAGRTTLPIAILQYLEWKIDPTVAAVSVMQIVLIGAAMLITDRYVKISGVAHDPEKWAPVFGQDHARTEANLMARLQLNNLSKRYGDQIAVAGATLDVADGEFMVLLGPSGCGKTTTLRMVAGFVEPSGGSATIGSTDVTYLPPWRRNTGMVFQSYALFPHMTVAENVGFGLEMRKLAKAEIAARTAEVLRLVRLDRFAERYPRQMSGGQQQRVALARALAVRPDVLLLDEPLSNLDAKLREEVRIEIRELQRQLGLTTIMVTHDQEEALTVADRLVVMSDGEIRQIGSQRDLYERPADRFVASFVGRSTFLDGKVTAPGEFETSGGLKLQCRSDAPVGPAALALRPERLSLDAAGQDNDLPGTVEFVSYLGAVLELRVRLSPADRVALQLPNHGSATALKVGDAVRIGWGRDAGLVFAQQ